MELNGRINAVNRLTAIVTGGVPGPAGFSPVATVEQTAIGATITITDKTGTTSANVLNGTATDAQVETAIDDWFDANPEAIDNIVVVSETQPVSGSTKVWIDSNSETVQVPTVEEINDLIDAVFPTKMLTDQPIASFNDGAKNIPVKALSVAITPAQSGSGTPSPSNVRPISGWTGAKVMHTGAGIWDGAWELGSYKYATDGSKANHNDNIRCKNYIPILPNTTYYMRSDYATQTNGFYIGLFYDRNKTYLGRANIAQIPTRGTFTTPSDAYYMTWYVSSLYGTTYNNDISINYPSTDTDYHVYSGTTYSVTFPSSAGTVYGGTLDVTTGKLTVDMALVTFNGTEDFTNVAASGEHRFTRLVTPAASSNESTTISKGKVSHGTLVSSWVGEFGKFRINSGSYLGILDKNDRFADDTALKSWLASEYANGTPLQIAYPLATPVEYTLTPTEVKTLLENNIWADTGNVSLTYRVDLPSYIAEAVGGA